MDKALYIGMSGAKQNMLSQRAHANNLANVSTLVSSGISHRPAACRFSVNITPHEPMPWLKGRLRIFPQVH